MLGLTRELLYMNPIGYCVRRDDYEAALQAPVMILLSSD